MQRTLTIGSSSPMPFALYDAPTGQNGVLGQTLSAINVPVVCAAGVAGNITVMVWQAGQSVYTPATGSVVERGYGIYDYLPAIADSAGATGSDDLVRLHITCAACQPYDTNAQVTAVNLLDGMRLGLQALPNVAAGNAGGIATANATGQVALNPNQLLPATANLVANSLGEALAATRADSMGKRIYQPLSDSAALMILYGADGAIIISQNVTIDPNGNVTSVQ